MKSTRIRLSPVERSLIRMLKREKRNYVLLVGELAEALRLYDEGFSVMLGDIDDPATYRRARAESAALVVTAQRDTTNPSSQLVIVGDSDAGEKIL